MAAAQSTEEAIQQRRRGAALEDAIRAAAFTELCEVGYAAFAVEAVATRARTGKASIYRRWPTKQALVLDSLCANLPTPEECGLVPQIKDDWTTAQALRAIARNITRIVNSPAGDAMLAIKREAAADPALAREVDVRFQAPRREGLLALLRRGVERGEVRPEAVNERVADILPAMLVHKVIMMEEKVTERDVLKIVDEIILPLIEVR
jgi:AcrR family transcriptional regulator